MPKDNKKWAINNLTYLARNFESLIAFFCFPCAFIYKKYFSLKKMFNCQMHNHGWPEKIASNDVNHWVQSRPFLKLSKYG